MSASEPESTSCRSDSRPPVWTTIVEERNHEDAEDGGRSMPPKTAVPRLTRLLAPAPEAITSGMTPSRNDRAVIRSAGTAVWRPRGRLDDRLALLVALLLGELDDENGVLGRHADQQHEADLGVDVVVEPTQHGEDDRAQNRQRHRQQTESGVAQLSYCAARKRKTMISASEKISGATLPASFCCWVTPDQEKPIELGRISLAIFSISSTASPSLNPGAGAPVIVADGNMLNRLITEGRPIRAPSSGWRAAPSALGGAHLETLDVADARPELLVGLHHDAPGSSKEIEVVDVGRAQVGLQRVEDRLQRDVESLGLLPIHIDVDLGHVGLEVLVQAGDLAALDSRPSPCRWQRSRAGADPHRRDPATPSESRSRPETLNRRGSEGEGVPLANLRSPPNVRMSSKTVFSRSSQGTSETIAAP